MGNLKLSKSGASVMSKRNSEIREPTKEEIRHTFETTDIKAFRIRKRYGCVVYFRGSTEQIRMTREQRDEQTRNMMKLKYQ